MRQHDNYQMLYAARQRMLPTTTPFVGTLYRACAPNYANTRDLLTGIGSCDQGGRWNAPKSFATIYLAQSFDGAIAETVGAAARYGFELAMRLPITLVAVDVRLARVLDFTDPRLRRVADVTLTSMNVCPWRRENLAGREALTQVMGRIAFELGLQGIIVPSAVKRTFRNLNVFPANLGRSGSLHIRSADKLPRPPSAGLL